LTKALGFTALAAPIANAGDWTVSVIATRVPAGAISGPVAVQANGLVSNAIVFTVGPTANDPASFTPSAVNWTAGPNLPSALSGAGVAFAQTTGWVYTVGGTGNTRAPVNTVNYAQVMSTGALGAWKQSTVPLSTAVTSAGAVVATHTNSGVLSPTGYLYVLGGATDSLGTSTTLVYRAAINANGTIQAWTSATALPAALHAFGATVQYGSLYVVGGANSANVPQTAVYRSPIQQDGSLGSWRTEAFPLPAPRARVGFGASGLYLYVFGGDASAVHPNDSVPSGAQVNTVYYAKLHPNTREVTTAWTATTPLPDARSALTAVFGAGNVLLTGGLYSGASGHANEAMSAPLNADGTVGTFTTAGNTIYSICGCNLFNHSATGYVDGSGAFHVLIVGGDDVSAPGTRRVETFTY
jgi:hypothetical protein